MLQFVLLLYRVSQHVCRHESSIGREACIRRELTARFPFQIQVT